MCLVAQEWEPDKRFPPQPRPGVRERASSDLLRPISHSIRPLVRALLQEQGSICGAQQPLISPPPFPRVFFRGDPTAQISLSEIPPPPISFHEAFPLSHQVSFYDEQQMLISCSVDKTVKIWDMRMHRCLQTITDKTHYRSAQE